MLNFSRSSGNGARGMVAKFPPIVPAGNPLLLNEDRQNIVFLHFGKILANIGLPFGWNFTKSCTDSCLLPCFNQGLKNLNGLAFIALPFVTLSARGDDEFMQGEISRVWNSYGKIVKVHANRIRSEKIQETQGLRVDAKVRDRHGLVCTSTTLRYKKLKDKVRMLQGDPAVLSFKVDDKTEIPQQFM